MTKIKKPLFNEEIINTITQIIFRRDWWELTKTQRNRYFQMVDAGKWWNTAIHGLDDEVDVLRGLDKMGFGQKQLPDDILLPYTERLYKKSILPYNLVSKLVENVGSSHFGGLLSNKMSDCFGDGYYILWHKSLAPKLRKEARELAIKKLVIFDENVKAVDVQKAISPYDSMIYKLAYVQTINFVHAGRTDLLLSNKEGQTLVDARYYKSIKNIFPSSQVFVTSDKGTSEFMLPGIKFKIAGKLKALLMPIMPLLSQKMYKRVPANYPESIKIRRK